MTASEVRDFLRELPDDVRAIVLALREVVLRLAPDAEETLLWGGLSYHSPWIGGRVKGALCQITAKRGEVRLEFIHGVRLRDPAGLLQGDRLSKRFTPLGSAADAHRPEIAALILEASSIELPPRV